ncbi:hypothetical protein [Hugenholtzia roseola]|uniref:hypothetical protein n=1 Tax=Hugenholtzia roseola TaxID=1002 RepID=UPI0003FC5A86|nr:hypothetical protein [Hugenholtzia roseola]
MQANTLVLPHSFQKKKGNGTKSFPTPPFLFLLSLLLLFSSSLSAGVPPKMSKETYKDLKGRAKKGSHLAMYQIAKAWQGDMFSSEEQKSYKDALKWYQMALGSKTEKVKKDTQKGLFEMYFLGDDKKVERNKSLSEQYLNNYLNQNPKTIALPYRKTIDLQNIFALETEAANSQQADILLEYARFLLEFEISYQKGVAFLDKAQKMGSPDAAYYKEQWTWIRSNRAKFTDTIPIMYQLENHLLPMAEKYAKQGSPLAKLETAWLKKKQNQLSQSEAEMLLQDFLSPNATDLGLKIAAAELMADLLPTKKKISLIREIVAIEVKDSLSENRKEKMSQILETFEEQIKTLKGVSFLAENDADFSALPLRAEDFEQAYQGNIKPLVLLYQSLNQKDTKQFFGDSNVNAYNQVILRRVDKVFEKANTADKVYAFKEAIEKEPFLKPIAPPYLDSLITQKLLAMGKKIEDLAFDKEKSILAQTTFKSLQDGKKMATMVQNRKDLTPFHKQRLVAEIKKKAVKDIYGESPTVRQIEQMKNSLLADSWLSGEAMNIFLDYKANSDNWFSGSVNLPRKGVDYGYEVKRLSEKEFALEVLSVRNNQSNLAYKTIIELQENLTENGEKNYLVKIVGAYYKTYGFAQSKTDYFQVTCRSKSPTMENATCVGNLLRYQDRNHGFSENDLKKQENYLNLSHKDAIRSAVRYFLIEYNGALGIK